MGVYKPLQDAEITPAKLSGAQSGSAPAYAVRAWVYFNGSGVVAIVGSGNVTSITDNSAGNFTVNFTQAMPDAVYGIVGQATYPGATVTLAGINTVSRLAASYQCTCTWMDYVGGGLYDSTQIEIMVIR